MNQKIVTIEYDGVGQEYKMDTEHTSFFVSALEFLDDIPADKIILVSDTEFREGNDFVLNYVRTAPDYSCVVYKISARYIRVCYSEVKRLFDKIPKKFYIHLKQKLI